MAIEFLLREAKEAVCWLSYAVRLALAHGAGPELQVRFRRWVRCTRPVADVLHKLDLCSGGTVGAHWRSAVYTAPAGARLMAAALCTCHADAVQQT